MICNDALPARTPEPATIRLRTASHRAGFFGSNSSPAHKHDFSSHRDSRPPARHVWYRRPDTDALAAPMACEIHRIEK